MPADLRAAARGQPCVGCGAPDAVLAHLRHHNAGMGQKCPDILGAHLCHLCHQYADGEGIADWSWKFLMLGRTIVRLLEQGVVRA